MICIRQYLVSDNGGIRDIVDREPCGGRIVETDEDICRNMIIEQRL
jgi:hypothetical protein